MPRPIEALIHADALAHNLARVRAQAPDARVWAVVKANAYGHGLERAFGPLRSADGFALLDLAEAVTLRSLDWRGPILLLEGVFEARDLELCSRLNLWHVLHSEQQIAWLAVHKTHQPHRVFLKMNSGMNRLGFTPTSFRSAWARLNAMPQVDEVSLMTHFADADAPAGIAQQVAAFDLAARDLPGERSVSNSAALLRHPELCRRLPAPLRQRHASAGRWPALRHRGPGVDGHARGRPVDCACSRLGQRGHAVGARAERQPAGDRRSGTGCRHHRLRADVRAGAAGACAPRLTRPATVRP